jgi:ubiquinone/menaquinone biosynthesis C-methylase UbiE
VLELGSGPGPFTHMLLGQGYHVVAVDFSEKSLLINRDSNTAYGSRVCYVKADLNSLVMARESSNLLLMCDFLQHLGDYDTRNAFISKVFNWLAPGGFFYLTFFNFNIKNYFKGDAHGSFASGAIRYERLLHKEVLKALPKNIAVDSVIPLNIFHSVILDRLASGLPGARYLARMFAICGRKIDGEMMRSGSRASQLAQ